MSERRLLFLMTEGQAVTFAQLVEAAERGDGDAACRLGDMYREGLGGLLYSPRQTYHWYARSAMAGDANGQNNLGACYEHGLGCAQSYAKAVKWYRLSVAQELGTASMNLGYCYLRGHGVPRDEVEALRLFRLAVEGGEERAAHEVERLEGNRDVARPAGVKLVPRPVSVAACPRGHAVDPSLEARTQLLLRDGPREQLRHSRAAASDADGTSTDYSDDSDTPLGNRATDSTPAAKGLTESANAATSGSVELVDQTQPGRPFGMVGACAVETPRPLSGDSSEERHADGRGAVSDG